MLRSTIYYIPNKRYADSFPIGNIYFMQGQYKILFSSHLMAEANRAVEKLGLEPNTAPPEEAAKIIEELMPSFTPTTTPERVAEITSYRLCWLTKITQPERASKAEEEEILNLL